MKSNLLTNVLLLVVFSAAAFTGAFNHEIWLDEAHHWLFARDSNSVSDLLFNMRYDGHPILWNLILFTITMVTQDVIFMQIANVCISIVAVGVFLFLSPFKTFERILFTAGYFILYEYTVISRNYSLLLVFLFLALVFYSRRNYILLGLSLAFLANTHLFGLSFALSIAGVVALEFVMDKNNKLSGGIVYASLIFMFGVALSVWQIVPPTDSNMYTHADRSAPIERIARTSAIFLKSFVPIPDISNYRFWNSNLLMSVSKPMCVFLSFVLFCVPFFLLKNRISLLILFYGNALVIISFVYFTDLNATRYYGAIYLALISCIWLSRSTTSMYTPRMPEFLKFKKDYSQQFFVGLLFIQAIAGVTGFTLDIMRPFSASKNAAEAMLLDKDITEYISAGCGAAPVSGYVQKQVYYLNIHKYGSFCRFEDSAVEDGEKIKSDAIEFLRSNQKPAFLITHIPLSLTSADSLYIKHVGDFDQSVLQKESYYIYRVSAN